MLEILVNFRLTTEDFVVILVIMKFKFKKSAKILPGVKLNLSNSGPSLTVGKKGMSVNMGKKGAFFNVDISGTGISAREKIGGGTFRRKKTMSHSASKTIQQSNVLADYIGNQYAPIKIHSDIDLQSNVKKRKVLLMLTLVLAILTVVLFNIPFFGWGILSGIAAFVFLVCALVINGDIYVYKHGCKEEET
jgi:hypothetical protein